MSFFLLKFKWVDNRVVGSAYKDLKAILSWRAGGLAGLFLTGGLAHDLAWSTNPGPNLKFELELVLS